MNGTVGTVGMDGMKAGNKPSPMPDLVPDSFRPQGTGGRTGTNGGVKGNGAAPVKEKECEICGAYFPLTHGLRKYCDKCRERPETMKRDYSRGHRESVSRYREPELVEIVCARCGKVHKTPEKNLLYDYFSVNRTLDKYQFCSRKCMALFKVEQADPPAPLAPRKCRQCGKEIQAEDEGRYYCSDECMDKYYRELAIRNGELHVCAFCGKEYRGPNRYFSNRDCMTKAQKNGWVSPEHPRPAPSPEKEKAKAEVHTCANCGKKYIGTNKYFCNKACNIKAQQNGWVSPRVSERERTKEQEVLGTKEAQGSADGANAEAKKMTKKETEYKEAALALERKIILQDGFSRWICCENCGKKRKAKFPASEKPIKIPTWFCSDACKKEYSEKVEKAEQRKVKVRKTKNISFSAHKGDDKKPVQLCASCKTPYASCERMQSEFRIIPKGAHYDENGVLVSCPKYKGIGA